MSFQGQSEALPADVQALISKRYRDQNGAPIPVALTALPYWSRVRVAATVAGTVLTVARQQVTAFGYGYNQDLGAAGQAGTLATRADTNIQQPGTTLNNSDVLIYGVGITIDPASEPLLLAPVFKESFLQITTDSRTYLPMGRLEDYPQTGGIFGAGQSVASLPPLQVPGSGVDGGQGAMVGFLTNGNPLAGSFGRFEGGPLIWTGQSANSSDNTLNIVLSVERTFTAQMGTTRAAAAGTTAAFTQPTAGARGTYIDLIFSLKAYQINPISSNA